MESIKIIINSIPRLLTALPVTLLILIIAVIIGILIGMGLTFIRLGNRQIPNAMASVYISFMRGTPLLIQLFLAYFGLPALLKFFGINTTAWHNEVFAIIAFSLNLGAFLSEVFRSAYLSVDMGQIEAAHSIGMNDLQTFFRIIFSQALRVAIPNMGNIIVDMLKNTSLAFSIGVVDVMGKGTQLAAAAFGVGQLSIFIGVAIIYIIVCTCMQKGFNLLEKLLSKDLNSLPDNKTSGSNAAA